jgi:hypothetical protein
MQPGIQMLSRVQLGKGSFWAVPPPERELQDKVSAVFGLHVIAYNLIRLGNLLKPVMEAA